MNNSTEVKNIKDFVDHVDNYDLISSQMVFRGQPKRGNLLPGIARALPGVDTTARERQLLSEFLRIGQLKIHSDRRTTLELMILAQHFGLKTRLLDWTGNPLAALWFACAARELGDVYVYALTADLYMLPTEEPLDPFNVPETIILRPNLGNERIVAQQGWFTLHRYSGQSEGFVPLEKNINHGSSIDEFIIPEVCRRQILESLDRFGVNESTLMPDLQGLARHVNWAHQV